MARSQWLFTAVGAFAFGLLAALVAGQDSDGRSTVEQIRNTIGNLSAPWLILALVAGAASTNLRGGAMAGAVATVSGLLGFYVLTALVVDVTGNGIANDLARLVGANQTWFIGGAVSGPLFGAAGAWCRRESREAVALLGGALLVGEPVVMALIGFGAPATVVGRDAITLAVHAAEAVLGFAVVIASRVTMSSKVGAHDA